MVRPWYTHNLRLAPGDPRFKLSHVVGLGQINELPVRTLSCRCWLTLTAIPLVPMGHCACPALVACIEALYPPAIRGLLCMLLPTAPPCSCFFGGGGGSGGGGGTDDERESSRKPTTCTYETNHVGIIQFTK